MDHGIFKLAALLFACAFYAAVLAWRFRGVLADSARALLGGWLTIALNTWADGYKEWDIPMDWGVHNMSMGRFSPDPTTQRYELTSDGTFTIRKFHFNALRTVYGETAIWHD